MMGGRATLSAVWYIYCDPCLIHEADKYARDPRTGHELARGRRCQCPAVRSDLKLKAHVPDGLGGLRYAAMASWTGETS